MKQEIWIKWKDKPKEELWLHCGYYWETRFEIGNLLSLDNNEEKIQYIKIK